jgi:hypothetical protein
MKLFRLGIVFIFFTQTLFAGPLLPTKYFKHEGGLNSRNVDTALEEEQASDVLNVYYDRGAVVQRGGFSVSDTYADNVMGMYLYELTHTNAYSRNNTDYFIKVEGGTLWATDGTNEYEIYDNWTSDVLTQFQSLSNQCFIADDGTNELLVYDEYNPLILRFESVDGWAIAGGAANLAVSTTAKEGTYSLEWDKTATNSIYARAYLVLPTQQDWTNYSDGYVSVWFDIPSTSISTVGFQIGNDSLNRYNLTTTVTETGWQQVGDILSNFETTGTPDLTSIDYMNFATVSSTATDTWDNFRVDAVELHCARPSGVIAPTTALTATGSSGAGNVDVGDHYYQVSYYTDSGASESNMGTASTVVTITSSAKQVDLTDIPCSPNLWVTKRKIWRTKVGASDAGPYYYLTTLTDNAGTTYTDNLADSSLGTTEEGPYSGSQYNDNSVPPKGKYMMTHKNRLFIAGNNDYPSRLYYSEFNEPQSFPTLNYYNINTDDNSEITGLGIYLNNPLIFKTHSIWALKGSDRFDYDIQRVNSTVGCVSGYTIVPVLNYLYFLGRRDVYRLGGSGIEIVSNDVRDKLESLNDSAVQTSAVAVNYSIKNQYWISFPTDTATTNNQTIVFDYDDEAWSVYDLYPVSATITDYKDDFRKLYWSDNSGNLLKQDYDSTGTAVWLDDDQNIDGYYTTKWYDMGTPWQEKEFPYIKLFAQNESGTDKIDVYWAMDYDDNWIGPVQMDISEGGTVSTVIDKIDLNKPGDGQTARGNVIKFKFQNNYNDEKFTLCGWVIYYRDVGGNR